MNGKKYSVLVMVGLIGQSLMAMQALQRKQEQIAQEQKIKGMKDRTGAETVVDEEINKIFNGIDDIQKKFDDLERDISASINKTINELEFIAQNAQLARNALKLIEAINKRIEDIVLQKYDIKQSGVSKESRDAQLAPLREKESELEVRRKQLYNDQIKKNLFLKGKTTMTVDNTVISSDQLKQDLYAAAYKKITAENIKKQQQK